MRTIALLLLPLAGCIEPPSSNCTDSGAVDLTVRGTGLSAYDGMQVHARLVEVERDEWIDESQQQVVEDGRFEIYWSCGLPTNEAHKVHIYIDQNRSYGCEAGKQDRPEPGWIIDIPPSVSDVVRNAKKDGNWDPDICDPF